MRPTGSNRKNRAARVFDWIEWALLHLTFILSLVFLTLWIFNLFNWQMEFLTSKTTVALMGVYFPVATLAAGMFVIRRAKNGVHPKSAPRSPAARKRPAFPADKSDKTDS